LANAEQLSILAQGLEVWNLWRSDHPGEFIDLSGADLRNLEFGLKPALARAHERGVFDGGSWSFIYNEIVGYDVMPLNLRGADLRSTKLDGADLIMADCQGADFSGASLKGANLHRADLSSARFVGADLSGADLRAANLSQAVLIRTNVEGTDVGYAEVFGVSVWSVSGTPADETNLLVTAPGELALRTDGLALSQLIHFLINYRNARSLIETVTKKLVLLLGNFKEERMAVLKAISSELRGLGFLPLIFDFERPSTKDTTGTVETLARMACFIVADLTDPSSIPHELASVVPFLRTTPVMLLREKGATGYSMVEDFARSYSWVIPVHEYETSEVLLAQMPDLVRHATEVAETLRGKVSGEG
jgi:uncharacterized protein YjbI with pentapeptide repeats